MSIQKLVDIAKTISTRLPETEQNELLVSQFNKAYKECVCGGCGYVTTELFSIEGDEGKYCTDCQLEVESFLMEKSMGGCYE